MSQWDVSQAQSTRLNNLLGNIALNMYVNSRKVCVNGVSQAQDTTVAYAMLSDYVCAICKIQKN